MLQIVCVKVKPAYSADYVNNLYRACKRHVTVPFEFVCITDDPIGLVGGMKIIYLPNSGESRLQGWWAKLYLFAPGFFEGRVLYLDLDTVIFNNIDDLANFDFDFGILRDFYFGKVRNKYGSGIMAFRAEKCYHIWDEYAKAGYPQDIRGGDQVFIEQHIKDPVILQDKFPGIKSYKVERFDQREPKHCRIVCFHGKPKPHELTDKQWIKENWL